MNWIKKIYNFIGLCGATFCFYHAAVYAIKGDKPHIQPKYDKSIQPHIDEYELITGKKVIFKIEIKDIKGIYAAVDGLCRRRNERMRYRIIELNKNAWHEMNYDERRWLIFHELGHCLEGREHLDHDRASCHPNFPQEKREVMHSCYKPFKSKALYKKAMWLFFKDTCMLPKCLKRRKLTNRK